MAGSFLRVFTARLNGLFVAGMAAVLTGCAAMAPPASPAPLLHDELFGQPPRPAEADSVMALDEPMHRYVQALLAGAARDKGRPRALTDALYARGELRLDYDSGVTRTAAQAFAARSGNCLSLVLMTAALARELGLDVSFQSATLAEAYSRSGDLTLQSGHVNLVLAPRLSRWHRSGVVFEPDTDRLQIDFLPPEALRGLRTVPISEQRVLAMFMNNRAVETLQQGTPAQAYAWVRESLRLDAGFWPAYNTLGVIYQREGHAGPAVAAFERVLAQDPDNLPAMSNLVAPLRQLGRNDEAAGWTARRLALQPVAPFQALGQAEAALARGDLDRARELLEREQALTGETHELHFLRAKLYAAMGRIGAAGDALQQAIEASETPRQRQVYAAKLERLRALAGGH